MERIKIDELIALHGRKPDGSKLSHEELADFVFKGERGRVKEGKRRLLSATRKRALIGAWNNGLELTRLKPRHLLRLSEFFKANDIRQLIDE